MEEKESNVTQGPADTSQPGKNRLVIRVVIPQEPATQTTTPSGLNARAIAVALVVLAALTVTWLGFTWFGSDAPEAPIASEEQADVGARSQSPESDRVQSPAMTAEAPAQAAADIAPSADAPDSIDRPASSAAQQQANASPSPVDQVIPEVPRSALDTIRGTVRVKVQVRIGKDGSVVAVTATDPGPSRYFERLSLEAARKWRFTPSPSEDERIMMIAFHYTRDGPSVHPSLPE